MTYTIAQGANTRMCFRNRFIYNNIHFKRYCAISTLTECSQQALSTLVALIAFSINPSIYSCELKKGRVEIYCFCIRPTYNL